MVAMLVLIRNKRTLTSVFSEECNAGVSEDVTAHGFESKRFEPLRYAGPTQT
jgi:hypothetical protein